jgi:hypothetical protein
MLKLQGIRVTDDIIVSPEVWAAVQIIAARRGESVMHVIAEAYRVTLESLEKGEITVEDLMKKKPRPRFEP